MANLTIQSAEHFVDSPWVTFRSSTTLTVAEAYHEHYGDASSVNTLNVRSAFHDHTAFEIKRMDGWYFLSIADNALAVDTPNLQLNLNYHGWMDESAMLPAMEIDAQSGIRINCPSAGLKLPGLVLNDMRAGGRLDKKLPDLGITATGYGSTPMRLDGKLPAISCDARGGFRAKSPLKLPTVEIEASGSLEGGITGSLDKTLPGLTIDASGYRERTGELDKDLPALTISATGSRNVTGELDANLPAFKITATGYLNRSGSLNENLPALEITAEGIASSMNLDANLPTLVMVAPEDGASAGGPSTMSNHDRFDGYVMRYAR